MNSKSKGIEIQDKLKNLGINCQLAHVEYQERYDSRMMSYESMRYDPYMRHVDRYVDTIYTVRIPEDDLLRLLDIAENFKCPNNPMARKAYDEYLMIKRLCETHRYDPL